MTPRPQGQNCKFVKTPLSRNSQKRLEHKENRTKCRKMTRKSQSHIRVLIYRTKAIGQQLTGSPNNNPRNTCGTHFGSSSLLGFKARYHCHREQKVVSMLIILHYFSQQLSKYTDAGHPDSFHIENALETMKQMINILNDSIQSSCKLAHNTQTRRSFKKR